MKIKEITKESRPRERLISFGIESLSDAEILSLILGNGSKGENVIDLSNKLISKYGLEDLFDCSLKELKLIKGIGNAKAMQILSIKEINKRILQSKKKKEKITVAKDVFDLFEDKLSGEKRENFFIVLLNTKNKILGIEKISVGILDASIIHPREIFKPAIKSSASRIILVHNHPSGDSKPSQEDLEITKKLIEVGNLIGIEILDHVIIGEGEFWSWVEN